MKIVVLDGYTLNPGDLDWSPLRALGDSWELHDRTPREKVIERAHDAEIVLTNKTVLDAGAIRALPRLRYIGVLATGFNVVDIEAARERGVPVTNIPSYGTASVAQMTFALLLELTQRVGHHDRTVRDGRWGRSSDFCYWDHPLVELADRKFGIFGFGHIGQAVGRIAAAFGMEVLVHTRTPPGDLPSGHTAADRETLFRESDVLSLHCPLTEATRHLINRETLSLMKSTAFLINTGRGPLIDEAALAEVLTGGRLAGAGVDVLDVEPPVHGSPLLAAPNCFITPHIGWATRSARSRLLDIAVDNLRKFLAGNPVHVVNPGSGDS